MTLVHPQTAAALALAKDFGEAADALNPEPLVFQGGGASQPLYIPRPLKVADDGMSLRSPGEQLRHRMLKSTSSEKAFLSGHIGSGKTTELRKLVADETLKAAFFPIWLEIAPAYRDKLDFTQLLFLIACELFTQGKNLGLHQHRDLWVELFRDFNKEMLSGIDANEGEIEFKFNLVFVEMREALKFQDRRRQELRTLGENNLQLLVNLIAGLVADMRASAAQKGDGREPLLIIDGLDKVREKEPQERTFRQNPRALLDLPLRIIYTMPTGVAFERCPQAHRELLVHIYPAPILKKENTSLEPEKDVNELGIHFLQTVLYARVEPGLFEPEAIRLAAIYSGGVLRNFFLLLRTGIEVAEENNLRTVEARAMRAGMKQLRLNESMSLHEKEYKTLAKVHATHYLPDGDGEYLDLGWVLECFNDKVWYEVNPLLWKILDPKA